MYDSIDELVSKFKNKKFAKEFTEFYEMVKCIDNGPRHDHETVFDHTFLVLEEYEKLLENYKIKKLKENVGNHSREDLVKIIILLHDIGKPDTLQTKEDGSSRFPNHEELSAKKAREILFELNFSKEETNFITSIMQHHSFGHRVLRDRKKVEESIKIFKQTTNDIYIETMILGMVDTLSSKKLEKNDKEDFEFRINTYKSILNLK